MYSYLHLKAAMEAAGWLLQSVPWRAGDGTMLVAVAAALYTKCAVAEAGAIVVAVTHGAEVV